jgi:hypothetical protein
MRGDLPSDVLVEECRLDPGAEPVVEPVNEHIEVESDTEWEAAPWESPKGRRIGENLLGTGSRDFSDPFQNVFGEGDPSFSVGCRVELCCQCRSRHFETDFPIVEPNRGAPMMN